MGWQNSRTRGQKNLSEKLGDGASRQIHSERGEGEQERGEADPFCLEEPEAMEERECAFPMRCILLASPSHTVSVAGEVRLESAGCMALRSSPAESKGIT